MAQDAFGTYRVGSPEEAEADYQKRLARTQRPLADNKEAELRAHRMVGTNDTNAVCMAEGCGWASDAGIDWYTHLAQAIDALNDETFIHARWHRALDDPMSEPPGPIRDHIMATLRKAWGAGYEGALADERGDAPWEPEHNPYEVAE